MRQLLSLLWLIPAVASAAPHARTICDEQDRFLDTSATCSERALQATTTLFGKNRASKASSLYAACMEHEQLPGDQPPESITRLIDEQPYTPTAFDSPYLKR